MEIDDDDSRRFKEAVEALYSSAHQARTPEALKRTALRRTRTVQDMRAYMRRAHLEVPSEHVRVVHVTGTKGKGSTISMCEAILRERYGQTTGLFTSPHLVNIRERIRINGKPVSEEVFAEAYWTLQRRLVSCPDREDSDLPVLPGYFRMLVLMALYVFTNYEPKVDVILLEVGMGGRYDATNILDVLEETRPVVCGVTLLDYDHMRVLGSTLEEIAWEKGGIFQVEKGKDLTTRPAGAAEATDPVVVPAQVDSDAPMRNEKRHFFALGTNSESTLSVLRTCASVEGQGRALHVVYENQAIPSNVSIGLNGAHQRINAELAVALCDALMEIGDKTDIRVDHGIEATFRALEKVSWPGRCQTLNVGWPTNATENVTPLHLCLDGAHTFLSLKAGLTWFQSQCAEHSETILIFNCSHERSPVPLLQLLVPASFASVYFCRAAFERPSMVGKPSAHTLLQEAGIRLSGDELEEQPCSSWQETLADVWRYLEKEESVEMKANVTVFGTVSEAFDAIHQHVSHRSPANDAAMQVLVTGSLYMVGSALDAVNWCEETASGSLKTT